MGALSAGCGSCKRRKILCDETRPKCNRCNKAGIQCTGFTQRLRFVDENPRVRRSMKVSQRQSHDFSAIISTSSPVFHSSQIPLSQPNSFDTSLANTLPLIAFKDEILISYLISKLFKGPDPTQVRCGLPKSWISELSNTPQMPRHKSWDALAALIFGQAHKSHEVVKKAHGLYGQALVEFRRILSDPSSLRAERMVASITSFYTYEILVSKNNTAWMSHANGLEWLWKWRGPWQLKSYAGKSIYREHKLIMIAKAIVSRQTTFLCDPAWKTIPWEDSLTSKLAIDYLGDIGANIADHVAQIKILDGGNSQLGYSQLRTRVAASLTELNTWWHRFESEHVQPATEITSSRTTRGPIFPTILEYDILWTSFTVCTYNAMRILLLQLWSMLQLFPNSMQAEEQDVVLDLPNRTALLGITSDIKGLASEILRSLEYSYGKSRRFVSTFSFFFIQDVAYGCFDKGSKEAMWVIEHGWAESAKFDHIEDSNLLKIPMGLIKAGDISLDESGHVTLMPQ